MFAEINKNIIIKGFDNDIIIKVDKRIVFDNIIITIINCFIKGFEFINFDK